MKSIILCFLAIYSINASAKDMRIYQQDPFGNTQYHKPTAVIEKDGRIIETDFVGNKQYQIKNGKIYETDSVGNIQYHKPSSIVK